MQLLVMPIRKISPLHRCRLPTFPAATPLPVIANCTCRLSNLQHKKFLLLQSRRLKASTFLHQGTAAKRSTHHKRKIPKITTMTASNWQEKKTSCHFKADIIYQVVPTVHHSREMLRGRRSVSSSKKPSLSPSPACHYFYTHLRRNAGQSKVLQEVTSRQ